MNDVTYWTTFFAAALVINVSPGPDIAYILSRSLAQGKAAGIASSLGVCTGAAVHVGLAAFGVAAAVATLPGALTAVQVIGALYLLWLAIPAVRSRGTVERPDQPKAPIPNGSVLRIFGHGVVVDILNPKVAIFFMAFLPQFVRPHAGSTTAQILTLGGLVILVALCVEIPLVLAAARASATLRRSPQVSKWLDRTMGCMFLLLAGRLLWSALEGPSRPHP
jgi:threonine/homoserine/homoserine lactone efflux protein